MCLLERYGEILNGLSLCGHEIAGWLPQLAKTFPARRSFPKLSELFVYGFDKCLFPHGCIQWLAAMVSTPLQPPGLSNEGPCADTLQEAIVPSVTPTRLKSLGLLGLALLPQDWKALIDVIDFSGLETLSLQNTNFSVIHLYQLIECIGRTDAISVPLEDLNLTDTDLPVDADKDALRARIQKAALRVTIQGL